MASGLKQVRHAQRLTIVLHPGPRIALALSLAAAVGATDESSAAGLSTPPAAGRIVVLGDSLAVSPSRSQNFVVDVQARLQAAHPGWSLSNLSYRGDTTSGGVQRFDRALTDDTKILVLELGANDGLRGVDVHLVEQNLSQMIETAQSRGIKVLLCGMEAPPLKGWNYSLHSTASTRGLRRSTTFRSCRSCWPASRSTPT
jgi:acyl-CoA thioesterase-1